jgi:hypothetical protein
MVYDNRVKSMMMGIAIGVLSFICINFVSTSMWTEKMDMVYIALISLIISVFTAVIHFTLTSKNTVVTNTEVIESSVEEPINGTDAILQNATNATQPNVKIRNNSKINAESALTNRPKVDKTNLKDT